MKMLIEGNSIKITGKHEKAIRIYYDEGSDAFSFLVCQNGMEISGLPRITFCKEHTVVLNNLPVGKSFID